MSVRVTYQWAEQSPRLRCPRPQAAQKRQEDKAWAKLAEAERAAEIVRWAGWKGFKDLAAHGDVPPEVVTAAEYAREMGLAPRR